MFNWTLSPCKQTEITEVSIPGVDTTVIVDVLTLNSKYLNTVRTI